MAPWSPFPGDVTYFGNEMVDDYYQRELYDRARSSSDAVYSNFPGSRSGSPNRNLGGRNKNPDKENCPPSNAGAQDKSTKQGGKFTEPNLPPKTVAQQGEVDVIHYTRSGGHGPPHLHVKGGGPETKIGQGGRPIDGSPELTATQGKVVEANKSAIRKAVDQIGRWFRFNELN